MEFTYTATIRIDGSEFERQEKADSYCEALGLFRFWLRGQDGKSREILNIALA